MWIVRIARDRPYTFIVLALLILIVSPVVIARPPLPLGGLQVAVVRNGRAELVGVTIGRDYGRSVEVVSGLAATDAVILDPSDSLVNGAAVRVRPSEPPKPKPAG